MWKRRFWEKKMMMFGIGKEGRVSGILVKGTSLALTIMPHNNP